MSKKTVPVLFFEKLRETLADLNHFRHGTSLRNLTVNDYGFATSL